MLFFNQDVFRKDTKIEPKKVYFFCNRTCKECF